MERPVFQPPGTPVEELDTPALVVDLGVMEQNIRTLHAAFNGASNGASNQSKAGVRPFVTPHQCPQIAHVQANAIGGAGDARTTGIAVTTAGEAEVFAQAGFSSILVASQIVTRSKIARLCALAASNRMSVAVDSPGNVASLSEAATAAGVSLGVLVELEAGLGRCGVSPGAAAVELAREVAGSPGLELLGVMAIPPADAATEADMLRQLQPALDTRELLEREGLPGNVSVAGTHNYSVAAGIDGITEVQAGSYPLMDFRYCQLRPEFQPAAKVLTSVISHPVDRSAVLDAGHKATGPDRGTAVLEGIPGAAANRFSAEHGVVDLEESAVARLRPGDRAWLVPNDLAMCVNQYDYIRAVRNGRLEGYWPVAARGRFT